MLVKVEVQIEVRFYGKPQSFSGQSAQGTMPSASKKQPRKTQERVGGRTGEMTEHTVTESGFCERPGSRSCVRSA